MEKTERIIIGIAGVAAGAGVTHFTIALANYSATVKKRKTAVIELSGNHAFEELGQTDHAFVMQQVSYYPNLLHHQIPEVLKEDYEVILLDLGSTYHRIRMELLRCNEKLIVGSSAPWRSREYIRFVLDEMGEDGRAKATIYLTNNGMRKDKNEIKRQIRRPVYDIPFLPDPFSIGKSQYDFFQRFF